MLPFHGKYPKLDPKSCVMPGAELAGDVELKEYASIWQNCALRGTLFPYTTLFRSIGRASCRERVYLLTI